jgi:DNA-3-methyladenine glycosylase I
VPDADPAGARGTKSGPDGRPRCVWALSPGGGELYLRYHDTEWGRPVHGDQDLFERLCLEAFQAGLSWLTILRKRPAFRQAFDGFEPQRVAAYDEADVRRLKADAEIVRNEAKIRAVIGNARLVLELEPAGGLDALLWSFAPESTQAPRHLGEVRATTPESRAMAAELRRRGFRFVGPTTAYALMQATGMVDDHLVGCTARGR